MGATARNWIFRGVLVLAAVAAIAAVSRLPVAPWVRLSLLAAGFALAADQTFRHLPGFDPFGRIRWRLPRRQREGRCCAITFDDGPGPATPAVLDVLAEQGVPATFFVLGVNAERHPDIVRRAHAAGHAIGVHGLTHAKLAGAGANEIEQQMEGARRVLEDIGVTPAPVYRTPHGYKSRRVFDVAGRHGFRVWAWSRGIWDTDRPAPDVLVRRATRLARPGMVLLLHDGRGEDAEPDVSAMLAALPRILRELKRRGFSFVRLSDV